MRAGEAAAHRSRSRPIGTPAASGSQLNRFRRPNPTAERNARPVELIVARIFLTLTVLSTLLIGVAFFYGINVEETDSHSGVSPVEYHMIVGSLGVIFVTLVHAIAFTYFMGTGRWLEETSTAYQLATAYHDENRRLKYRVLRWVSSCFVLTLLVVASGSATRTLGLQGQTTALGVAHSTLHFAIVVVAILVNVFASYFAFSSIERNGEIIEEVLGEVRRIRTEKGLPV